MLYPKTYEFLKDLISIESLEYLEDIESPHKEMLVLTLIGEMPYDEIQGVCRHFKITPPIVFELLNIKKKNNYEEVNHIQKSVVDEVFLICRYSIQNIFDKAMEEVEKQQENKKEE